MSWKLTHPVVYPAVDCAIFKDRSYNQVYLAKKPNQEKWRFVGGFVDPSDISYQHAAMREAFEETGIECIIDGFITSRKVNDPRYVDSEDKVVTTMFAMIADDDSNAKAMDDIAELKLFDVDSLREDDFMPEHKPLFVAMMEYLDELRRGCSWR